MPKGKKSGSRGDEENSSTKRENASSARVSSEIDRLCKKILNSDDSILSLTINDEKGEILGHAFGQEYEKKYMELASEIRSRAGLFSALIFGISAETEKVFGEIESVVRIYSKAVLILVPFESGKKMVTILAEKRASPEEISDRVKKILERSR